MNNTKNNLSTKAVKKPQFGRVLTAMATPFYSNNKVDYTTAENLASYLSENGTDTIVVCGTTGESPSLSWDEEYGLFKAVQQAVAGKAKVIAGTGSNSTLEAVKATQKAEKLGVDGTLQVVPYYNKPSQSGLYEHFRTVAQAVPDLPIMLYNVPGRTGCNLSSDTTLQLANISNIIAVKEASGNIDQASKICHLSPPGFEVYSGDDSLTLPMLAVGAVGVVSVASHLIGEQIQQMIRVFEAGRVREAKAIHLKFFPLFQSLFSATNPIPLKAALSLQGWPMNHCRLPLQSGSSKLYEEIEVMLSQMGLLENIYRRHLDNKYIDCNNEAVIYT